MSKAMHYRWASCIDCREEDKMFKVRWPDQKAQMVEHLNTEHDYDVTEADINEEEDGSIGYNT